MASIVLATTAILEGDEIKEQEGGEDEEVEEEEQQEE